MINVGIIGLGVGEAHIPGFNAHPGCRVTKICDFDEAKLKSVKERHSDVEATASADDILDDPSIGIVSVASFDNFHHDQILKAIKNGKHIFVEKPLCLYEHEAKSIRTALNGKPHLKMGSNLVLRKSPRFIDLRERINRGELGKLYYVEGDYNYGRVHKLTNGWRGDIDFYSVVYGGGVHLIDLLLWLTGDEIVEVSAAGNRFCTEGSKFKHNDLVVSLLKFKSGMVGKMAANFGCVQPHYHGLMIYGTEATFVNGRQKAEYWRSRDPNICPEMLDTAYPGVAKGALIFNFVDSILTGSPGDITAEDVFKTMSVCFAIEKAVNQSGSVKVEYI